jgi:hypothetical protein
MSDDYQRIEVITGTAGRRRWTTNEKLRIVAASFESGETIFSGSTPQWRGGEPVVSLAAADE